jgi:signal peptidase I
VAFLEALNLKAFQEALGVKEARFRVPYVAGLAWVAFTALSIPLGGLARFDAFLALALAAKVAVAFFGFKLVKAFFVDGRRESYAALRKLAGYAAVVGYSIYNLPHVTWVMSGAMEREASVLHWVFNALASVPPAIVFFCLYAKKAQVHWGFISEEEARDKKLLEARRKAAPRSLARKVVDAADFVVQTILLVVAVWHFAFQLYVIPSESMVASMFVGDRPFVLKALDGPAIPFSPLKLPRVLEPHRGDVVVFDNPYYDQPVGHQIAQQALFFLSLTTIDLDQVVGAEPHFVVKRVVGEGGDELALVDDALWRKVDGAWALDPDDSARRVTDVLSLPPAQLKRVNAMEYTGPDSLSQADWKYLKRIDGLRSGADLAALAASIDAALEELARIKRDAGSVGVARMFSKERTGIAPDILADLARLLEARLKSHDSSGGAEHPFVSWTLGDSFDSLLYAILTSPYVHESFASWCSAGRGSVADDPYARAGAALNALWRKGAANKLVRKARQLSGLDAGPASGDEISGSELKLYLKHYTLRNFPAFRVPEGNSFLMGDNRYNSLDFRFRRDHISETAPIDPGDPDGLSFRSLLEPAMRGLSNDRVVGRALWILFPFDRFGAVR